MTYYIIVRSHYYGPKVGPWHLLADQSGEPVTFAPAAKKSLEP